MKRQISMREALDAGIGDSPALGPLTDGLTFHLWRSRPGYRKACRLLRRRAARLQALGRYLLGVEMKPKYARRALGILLDPFYFCNSQSVAQTVFPMRPVTKADLPGVDAALRSGRLAIVGAEVSPVPCSSPEEEAAARAGRRIAVSLRLEEWLPDPEAVAGIIGLDLATSQDETAVLRYNPETGDMEPLEPEDYAAMFDEE